MPPQPSSSASASNRAEFSRTPPPDARPPVSLLDLAIDATDTRQPAKQAGRAWIDREATVELAVDYARQRLGYLPKRCDAILDAISCDIARIDELISSQLNAILHLPRFQELEAAWRGLELLVNSAAGGENVKVGALNVSRDELSEDLQDALEFDQSEIFRKVYEEEYGMPGGEPFGVLIGNYAFRHTPADVDLLTRISGVAAGAFAPFIAGVHPEMFNVARFDQLERITGELSQLFEGPRLIGWNSLRTSQDSRFLGLAMPRVLMRLPYQLSPTRGDGFVFSEDISAPDNSNYLWGNAAFAFGGVLIRSFVNTGWLADIRGTMHGIGSGGIVSELPAPSFGTDAPGIAPKLSIETNVGELRERELSELGFIPLCDCPGTSLTAFYATQSLNKPQEFVNDAESTTNARLSSMLQYVLCASRFAHYLKTRTREKVGSPASPSEMQAELHEWLHQFVAADPGASAEVRARFPLRSAAVEVRPMPGQPGHYRMTLQLSPHYQLDDMSATVKLVSQVRK